MKKIAILLIIGFAISCAQKKQPLIGETEFQRKLNADFKDASISPLKDKDRKNFTSLDFFKYDANYVVSAILVRTPDEIPFKMKTNTERMPEYVKYGIVEFQLLGETYQLNLYQNLDESEDGRNDNALFLPFLDHTNGDTSYGGGRYLEFNIPEKDTFEIDFNKAFNPYCVYNEKYSCPIVPRENYLPIEIKAGLKDFKKL